MANLQLTAEQYFSLDGFDRPGSGVCLDDLPFKYPVLANEVEGKNEREKQQKAWAFSSFMIFNHLPLDIQTEVLRWGWQETETRAKVAEYLVKSHFGLDLSDYYDEWDSRFKDLAEAQDTPIDFSLLAARLKKE